MEDEPGVAEELHRRGSSSWWWVGRCDGGGGGHAAGSSRRERPVWRRKTSSRLGRASVRSCGARPAPSRSRMSCGTARLALVDVEADQLVLDRGLADEGLGADERRGRARWSPSTPSVMTSPATCRLSSSAVPSATIWPWSMIARRSREGVGLLEVVGGQEDRGPELAQVADLVPHARAGLRVEARSSARRGRGRAGRWTMPSPTSSRRRMPPE